MQLQVAKQVHLLLTLGVERKWARERAYRVGPTRETRQLELPLGSLGTGEYAIALNAAAGESQTRALTAFRVR